jgi:DNA-binding transcriptional MerR regulator
MTHKAIYMKRIILGSSLLFCALFTAPAMHAQESVEVLIRENGTERQESIELPKSMTYPLDSLLNDWKAKNYIDLGKDCSTSTVNPMFSDSVYIDRLSRMPTVMEMPYNEIVRKFIDMYAGRLRNQVAFMLNTDKNLKLYYSISEVAAMFDVNESLLRFWEKEFPQLNPKKGGRGIRQYRKEDIETVKLIYHLVKERGMTLPGARQRMKDNKEATIRNFEIVDRLRAIREELVGMKLALDEFTYEDVESLKENIQGLK